MIPGARLIILGRQGAGKGTQCVRLSRHYVVPHISTGDMLRAAVRERTELGLMAKEVMDAGGLVGDDIMIGIVDERLRRPDADDAGLHPRRLPAHGRPGRGARQDHRRPADRRRHRPRRAARHRAGPDLGPPGVPGLRHELHGDRHRAPAVDLRGVRRRRHAARRRHARRRQPPPRPLRDADRPADRVLRAARAASRSSTASATPTTCSAASTDAVDEPRRTLTVAIGVSEPLRRGRRQLTVGRCTPQAWCWTRRR